MEASSDENENVVGPFKEYFRNGNLKVEGIIVENSNDGSRTYEFLEGKYYKKNGRQKRRIRNRATISLD